ncbi:polar amino acid transport system permease protein [Cupriavidus metallidurans]|mgnify:FL=1|jgi:polar amino acid transport system permease protein|uniref:Glutamate and aspartate transporter subunit membrane component of ABC superfamily n=1 Tax=Cupriavidus metallidurans (strain ATCC 43123 / DSM 2839 / NBRC 102507 / CH34) TaxID=266264 RepID=Q1LQJ9_CUPMC|nr:amino acid ABC transporter permease [Cupriavidus metallidurans]ABF07577.1 glutamate and aspartate transporter subunit; membrane component of ABC superfamily [Cupriavidus metallidurans CH34]AVA32814.1 amino acid ABC transporter permease [Cupriavidus metallidurans]MDE4916985.1 amino acid ABC transporter permease [Cupriavidus metallidurans]QGS28109.1 ABC transporter permease subunit [Cupriavidus metallidurans]UBM11675.1 amino acid ABC transporter permease [Cupriavidus metallidurans]
MPTFNLSMLLSGQYHEWLVSGFVMSLKLSVIAFAISLPLAIVIALLRLAPLAPLRGLGQAYVEAIRNVPLLAHMLFWYFGAPQLLPFAIKSWLYEHNYEAVSALIALVLYTTAYMAEDIRSGIRSIPKEQLEASRALGFSFLASMRLVVLPQSLRITVPPLVNQILNLWKNSSIAMVIGVAELMYQAQQVESATFRGFESFAFATLAYLTISMTITLFSLWYQHRFPVRSM